MDANHLLARLFLNSVSSDPPHVLRLLSGGNTLRPSPQSCMWNVTWFVIMVFIYCALSHDGNIPRLHRITPSKYFHINLPYHRAIYVKPLRLIFAALFDNSKAVKNARQKQKKQRSKSRFWKMVVWISNGKRSNSQIKWTSKSEENRDDKCNCPPQIKFWQLDYQGNNMTFITCSYFWEERWFLQHFYEYIFFFINWLMLCHAYLYTSYFAHGKFEEHSRWVKITHFGSRAQATTLISWELSKLSVRPT